MLCLDPVGHVVLIAVIVTVQNWFEELRRLVPTN